MDLHINSFEKIVNKDGTPLSQFVTKWQGLLRGPRGALVVKSANQTGADYSGGGYLTWNTETYDTTGFHDTATSTDRLTIPKGVSRVRVGVQVTIDNITANSEVMLGVALNALLAYPGIAYQSVSANATTVAFQTWTPMLSVAPGDYFRAFLQIPGDSSVDIIAANSWFAIEVLE